MGQFLNLLAKTRQLMSQGEYHRAFESIVNEPVSTLPELLKKIECLIDIGFILRDEKILRYGLYLLEKSEQEVVPIKDLAPTYLLNLAQQYCNIITLSSVENETFGFFLLKEQIKAVHYFKRALEYETLDEKLRIEGMMGLAQLYHSFGRGLEALILYQSILNRDPHHKKALKGKILLLNEYGGIQDENSTLLFKEAWFLLDQLGSSSRDFDDQEEFIYKIKGQIEKKVSKEELEKEEAGFFKKQISRSEHEHFFQSYCLQNGLYLNLCRFCKKCGYAIGDRVLIKSDHLSLNNRYTQLNLLFCRIEEDYSALRYQLVNAVETVPNCYYAEPFHKESNLTVYKRKSLQFNIFKNIFLSSWNIWNLIALFMAEYWAWEGDKSSLTALFSKKSLESIPGMAYKSPSLQAIYSLYKEIIGDSHPFSLVSIYKKLKGEYIKENYAQMDEVLLEKCCVMMLQKIRTSVLYLSIMYNRNERKAPNWSIERPLYSFLSQKENK